MTLSEIDILPKAVVFDLDDTLWGGEVDRTGGPPFVRQDARHSVQCRQRVPVRLFDEVPRIFDHLFDHGIPAPGPPRVDQWRQENC